MSADDETRKRTFRLTSADTIEAHVPTFLWEKRIPIGTMAIAAGRGGEGKSSFAIWLAAQVSCGMLAGCHEGTPRDTIYVSVEDAWGYTMVPRLIAAGADLSRVHRFDVLTETGAEASPSLPVDVNLLRDAIRQTNAALVVIDPLLSSITGDSYKAQETRQALEPVTRIADAEGCAILGILHFGKAAHVHAGNAINGSTAFRDLARSVFLFARDQETDTRVMTQDKNSYARDDLPSLEYALESTSVQVSDGIADVGRFTWLGESAQTVRDLMFGANDDESDDRTEAERWLLHKLEDAEGSAPAAEILRAAKRDGFSERTIQRARKKLADSSKSGYQGAWVWTLNIKDDSKTPNPPRFPQQAPLAPSVAPWPTQPVLVEDQA